MNQDKQRAAFEAWTGYSEEALSRDAGDGYCIKGVDNEWRAWQAALASPEVQALRKDAERYRKLVADWFDHVHGREFELMNDMPPESYQSKADIDEEIDKTMEKQK